MHVIVPEIVSRHHDEAKGRGNSRTGINDCFEDLGYEDNKFDLSTIIDIYAIGADTVTRVYGKDLECYEAICGFSEI